MNVTVYTIGHSTHPIDEFIGILRAFAIKVLADVRTIAKSRHNPQFNEESLRGSLREEGIDYLRLEGLGGLRHTTKDSVNKAWINTSFRGYADYMQTPEFAANLAQLIEIAHKDATAIMCAEAVPWRCHRSLIGDALLARGIEVVDIMGEKSSRPHTMTRFAEVDGEKVTYPDKPATP